ncbi:hypothetical protein GCM10023197_15150 [Gordonia humi]
MCVFKSIAVTVTVPVVGGVCVDVGDVLDGVPGSGVLLVVGPSVVGGPSVVVSAGSVVLDGGAPSGSADAGGAARAIAVTVATSSATSTASVRRCALIMSVS